MLSVDQDAAVEQPKPPVNGAAVKTKNSARARAKRTITRSPGATVIEYLDRVRWLIARDLEPLGLGNVTSNFGAFRLLVKSAQGKDTHYRAFVSVRPGLGVSQPLEVLVMIRDGVPELDAGDLAHKIVEQVVAIAARREKHAATRIAIKLVVEEVVAEAAKEGIQLELLNIEAQPYDPEFPREDYDVFDVAMLLLGDDNGLIEMDCYTMDASKPEEFASYLRHRILPEQREFRARLEAGLAG